MAQPLVALQAALPQLTDPAELAVKAYTLRDLAAKAQAADQALMDDQAARAAFSANPDDGAARLSALASVSPAAYSAEAKRQSELSKNDAETRAKQIEAAHKQLDMAGQAFGYVRRNPTLDNATQAIKWLTDNGVYTPEQAAQYTNQVTDNPAGIKALADQAFTATLATKDQLPKIETKDNGGQLVTQAIDPVSNKVSTLSTMTKVQSPDNKATNDRIAAEGRANRAAQAELARERRAAGDTEPSLDPKTLDTLAEQAIGGDNSVYTNLGRGAQGAANLVALRNRVAQKASERGLSGADLASINADYQGQKAGLRTSGTISARVENAAAEAEQLAPLAIDAGRKVARAGLLVFGKGQNVFDTQTNNPDFKSFAVANQGLVTAYAGAMARGGPTRVADIQHAEKLIGTAENQTAYEAGVNQLLKEIAAAKRAPRQVRESLRNEISGRGGHDAPAPASGAGKVVDFGSLK